MTRKLKSLERFGPYGLTLLFLTGLCYLMFFRQEESIDMVFGLLATALFGYVYLYKKQWLLHILWLLIPMSIAVDLLGERIRLGVPSEILMAVIGFWFLCRMIFRELPDKRILLHPVFILLVLDLLWLSYVSFFSTMPLVSVKRVVMRLAYILVFYLLMAHWFRDIRRTVIPYLWYGVGFIPVIYFTLKKHAIYNFIPSVSFSICQPYYLDHTIYGACLAFLLPMILLLWWHATSIGLRKRGKYLLGVLFFILLIGTILSYSRASWLSLVACVLLYGLIRLRMRISGILFLLLITGAVVYSQFDRIYEVVQKNEAVSNKADIGEHIQSVANLESDASNLERINRWICAYEMFKDRPFTGFGPGTYQFEYGKYQSLSQLTYISTFYGDRGNAHSEYLTYLSETGWPGLVLFLTFAFYVVHLGLKVIYKAEDKTARLIAMGALFGLTTFFTHGLVNAFIDQDKMASLVYTSLAVLVVLDLYQQDKKKNPANGEDQTGLV